MKSDCVTNCFFYNGYKPCRFEKVDKCGFVPIEKKILIIKKWGIGEILRCTTILRKLKTKNTHVTWITDHPELLNKNFVDRVLKFDLGGYLAVKGVHYDEVYNLDKELECCSLLMEVSADYRYGFRLDNFGNPVNVDSWGHHLFLKGVDDEYMRGCKRDYVDEIFEVCGLTYEGEGYVCPDFECSTRYKRDKVVGVNTGCGEKWVTRVPSKDKWVEVVRALIKDGFDVVLLGGKREHGLNKQIQKETNCLYFGYMCMSKFFGLVNWCDCVITCVTSTLHIALCLDKPVVLLNNIFNRHEFNLFGRGVVLEPKLPCGMCYKKVFDDGCVQRFCMDLVPTKDVVDKVKEVLSYA